MTTAGRLTFLSRPLARSEDRYVLSMAMLMLRFESPSGLMVWFYYSVDTTI